MNHDLATIFGLAGAGFGTVAVTLAVLLLLGAAWMVVALFASLSVSALWLGHANR